MHFWNFQESARSVLSVLSAEMLSAYMRSGESGDVYFVFASFHGTHLPALCLFRLCLVVIEMFL